MIKKKKEKKKMRKKKKISRFSRQHKEQAAENANSN